MRKPNRMYMYTKSHGEQELCAVSPSAVCTRAHELATTDLFDLARNLLIMLGSDRYTYRLTRDLHMYRQDGGGRGQRKTWVMAY